MRDINFFRYYTDSKKAASSKNFYLLVSVAAFVVVVLGIYIFNVVTIAVLNREIAEIDQFIRDPQSKQKLQAYEETKQKNEILTNYYNALEVVNTQLSQKDKLGSELMLKVSAAMPKDVFAEMITFDTKSLSIQGVATNRNLVAQFQHNLMEEKAFGNVYVSSINIDASKSDNYVFVLKCELRDVEQ